MLETFECHWQASRWLLRIYIGLWLLSCVAIGLSDIAAQWQILVLIALCCHAYYVLPRSIRLTSQQAITALRHSDKGWQVLNKACGWQSVQLYPDSIAQPWLIVLRFRLAGQKRKRGLCLLSDNLSLDQHRLLRVRLAFAQKRWKSPD